MLEKLGMSLCSLLHLKPVVSYCKWFVHGMRVVFYPPMNLNDGRRFESLNKSLYLSGLYTLIKYFH